MKQEKKNDVAVLLEYAGSRRGLKPSDICCSVSQE